MTSSRLLYLDNASTSWPKPECMMDAMNKFTAEIGASSGRGAHRLAVESSRQVYLARKRAASLLGVKDESRIVFTLNATEALNLAIKGVLRDGDHVVATGMQHNSVVRPLRRLTTEKNVTVTYVPFERDGSFSLAKLRNEIRPNTRAIIAIHVSNAFGIVAPLSGLAELAKQRSLPLLVDGAQGLGNLSFDLGSLGVDLYAFCGHKAILGPHGTGGLYIREGLELSPLVEGSTGSESESDMQPAYLPDRFESGTQNCLGLAGLAASADFILSIGLEKFVRAKMRVTTHLVEKMKAIPGIELYFTGDLENRTPILAFNVKGHDSSETAEMLDKRFGILVRAGLHCAPMAHKEAGTLERGIVRASIGPFVKESDIDYFVECVDSISSKN
ncbi:MAG: aminotransferase class V-fold PLP-dependent enzyme [Candidatus Eisenbacteria bacterium]|nr:aminotransferase class V-fold PLP-dependent enzyme [Candidatus Eisenbacteria bacterium]